MCLIYIILLISWPTAAFYSNVQLTFSPCLLVIICLLGHSSSSLVSIHKLRRGVHSTKPEFRFCAGSNPARGVSKIRNREDLWQWFRLEIRLKAFHWSTISQKQFIIIHGHLLIVFEEISSIIISRHMPVNNKKCYHAQYSAYCTFCSLVNSPLLRTSVDALCLYAVYLARFLLPQSVDIYNYFVGLIH